MKVSVKDLQPNPYRRLDRYPVDREKVKSLKLSIKETTFWDNILARPGKDVEWYEDEQAYLKNIYEDGAIIDTVDPTFEIAYGHHRLIALREMKIDVVDIPVKDIDDATMLKIMANENLEDWKVTPLVINETVGAAKRFIDDLVSGYDCYENALADKSISQIFNNKQEFVKVKTQGAGRESILKFLGGNWKQWQIQNALKVIKQDESIDRKKAEAQAAAKKAEEQKQARLKAEYQAQQEAKRIEELERKRQADAARAKAEAERKRKQAQQADAARLAKMDEEKRADEQARLNADRELREQERQEKDWLRQLAEKEEMRKAKEAAENARRLAEKAKREENLAKKDAEKKQAAANDADSKGVNRIAFEMFPTLAQARAFSNAVAVNKVPKPYHLDLAKYLISNNISSDSFNTIAATYGDKPTKKTDHLKLVVDNPRPDFEDAANKLAVNMAKITKELRRMKDILNGENQFQDSIRRDGFYLELIALNQIISEINIPKKTTENREHAKEEIVL